MNRLKKNRGLIRVKCYLFGAFILIASLQIMGCGDDSSGALYPPSFDANGVKTTCMDDDFLRAVEINQWLPVHDVSAVGCQILFFCEQSSSFCNQDHGIYCPEFYVNKIDGTQVMLRICEGL